MSVIKVKNKIKLIFAFYKFKVKVKKHRYVFVFPYYHIGGGERVHLDILGTFNKKDVLCIIANKSSNDALKKEFSEVSTVFDLGKFDFEYKYLSRFAKKAGKFISSKNIKTIFGSNNYFFYLLIDQIKSEAKIIDLTHAFTYENNDAIEKISLPFVAKIDTRIVLGKKTFGDYTSLYKDNSIELKFLERFKIIKNAIQIPEDLIIKNNSKSLKVLFVGRNSPEKRPELLFTIIEKCFTKKLPFDFTIIGDFYEFHDSYQNFNTVKFIGELNNSELISEYYKKADVLLITSSREGLPMVILEAMANSATIIATNVGEIFELINTENDNGILIANSDDIEDLSNKFIEHLIYLHNNKSHLLHLQKNAYHSIKKDYNKLEFKKNYTNIIDFE